MKNHLLRYMVVFALTFLLLIPSLHQSYAADKKPLTKTEKARLKAIEVQVLLMNEKYKQAYAQAEELISTYAGDSQIGLYVSLWGQLFRLQDEPYRKTFNPDFEGIKRRIEQIKAIEDMTEFDLVKLISLVGEDREQYCKELLKKFPDSIWKDWAEWMLLETRTVHLGLTEKYKDRDSIEQHKLVAKDLYQAGKKFIDEHPDSYMLPHALAAVTTWKDIMLKDHKLNEERIELSRRILREYPEAEYYCAWARERLRVYLGENCTEVQGFSKEHDNVIRDFYSAHHSEWKRAMGQYLKLPTTIELLRHADGK